MIIDKKSSIYGRIQSSIESINLIQIKHVQINHIPALHNKELNKKTKPG